MLKLHGMNTKFTGVAVDPGDIGGRSNAQTLAIEVKIYAR